MAGTGTAVRTVARGDAAARQPAAALKYDILTALGTHGCAGDRHRARLALRLIVLLTARYNWREDSLSTGQREIAALWSVDERTVKRQMARLRELHWLVLRRPAARGRVACYGLGLDAIRAATCADWGRVGPDYQTRMGGGPVPDEAPTVVPFPEPGPGIWGRIAEGLRQEDPAVWSAWFAGLVPTSERGGVLRLRAPSRFHATFVQTHHAARLAAHARLAGLAVEVSA